MSLFQWILDVLSGKPTDNKNLGIETSLDIILEEYKPRRLQKVIDDDLEYLEGIAKVRIWMPDGVALGIVYARGEEIGRVPDSIAKRLRINLDQGEELNSRIISATEDECVVRCTPE